MIKRIVGSLFIGIPMGNLFCDLVGSIAKVDGCSMQPTLNPDSLKNDFIFVKKWDRFNVSKGDVVVFTSPKDPNIRLVKRIVALEGDFFLKVGPDNLAVNIPSGHVWVEGDHHDFSMDSNSFGAIPLGLVVGKAVCIIWPLNRIQFLKTDMTSGIKIKSIPI